MLPGLAEQVAIVTGASRGIGRAIAQTLATEGAMVVVNYASSSSAADEVVAEITQGGGQAIALQADVSQADQVDQLVNTVMENGDELIFWSIMLVSPEIPCCCG